MRLEISLQPKQKLFLQTIEKTPITFFGGAKGGGKSKALQLIQIIRRLQYQKSIGAIFRRSFPELEGNHIRPMFQSFPELRPYYNESKKTLHFQTDPRYSFVIVRMKKMWLFIRAESFMIWQLMKLGNGQRPCSRLYLGPTAQDHLVFHHEPCSLGTQVELAMVGSKGFLLKSVLMNAKDQPIMLSFKHWWPITDTYGK